MHKATTSGRRWMYTVEKASTASARALESRLIEKDARFRAVVQPDLPPANTWSGLLRKTLAGARGRGGPQGEERRRDLDLGVDVVQTVAVNLRTRGELGPYLRTKVAQCRERFREGEGGRIGALLCVSGGHPARGLPFLGGSGGLLADSTDLIREAKRDMDHLARLAAPPSSSSSSSSPPPPLDLWCVENPLLGFDARKLESKLESGATKIVTQPPLLRDSFQRWFDQCASSRLFAGGAASEPFVVGIPAITSTRSLSFWLEICGVSPKDDREASKLLETFQSKEDALSGEDFDRYCLDYVRGLLDLARDLPHVGGLHFMPVTPKGYRQILLVSEWGCGNEKGV